MSSTTVPDSRKLVLTETELRQARDVLRNAPSGRLDHWIAAQHDGPDVALPREISAILTTVLETVARSGTVTVGALPEDLTTTTAADLLGISRPTLMKLVATGQIPAHKVGSHTRLKATDVLDFRRDRLDRQRKALEELIALEDAD